MNRSPGVTASAVVAILGSLGVGVMAAFMIFGGLMLAFGPGIANTPAPYPTPIPIAAVLAIEILLFAGFAIFGIVSAIGLLRLKNWARISFLVFAVILAFCAGSSIFGGIAMIVAMPAMPPNANVPPGLMTVVGAVMITVALLLGALAIWWLIYFSRQTIKAQFMGEIAAAVPRRGPLSITIIAWWLLVSAFSMLIAMFVSSYPVVFMGTMIEGWAGRVIYLLWAGCLMAAGIGLLTWRRWAHAMAIGMYVFALLNTVLSLATGAMSRMQEIIQQRMPPTPYPVVPMSGFFNIIMVFVLVISVVIFWFLFSRRRAFLAACDATAPAMAAG